MILLSGGGSLFFGVQTQFEKVFQRRGGDEKKQLFFLFLCLIGAAGVARTIFLLNGS